MLPKIQNRETQTSHTIRGSNSDTQTLDTLKLGEAFTQWNIVC